MLSEIAQMTRQSETATYTGAPTRCAGVTAGAYNDQLACLDPEHARPIQRVQAGILWRNLENVNGR